MSVSAGSGGGRLGNADSEVVGRENGSRGGIGGGGDTILRWGGGDRVVVSIVSDLGRKVEAIGLDTGEFAGDFEVCTLSASTADEECLEWNGLARLPCPGIQVGVDIPEALIPGVECKNTLPGRYPPTVGTPWGKNGGVHAST